MTVLGIMEIVAHTIFLKEMMAKVDKGIRRRFSREN